jgi:DNA polymerase V
MSFPSPALDFDEVKIDLNRELVWHPASTFFGRVKGDALRDAGIGDGDILVIDKSLEPANGKIAVCFLDGEFALRRIVVEKGSAMLVPANPQFAPIQLADANDLRIWGIVTYAIKQLY